MKVILNAFLISCWVRIFHIWQFFVNLFKYYLWNWKFFLVDTTLCFLYFFRTPFRYIRLHDESHKKQPLGPYGETEFSACEKILSEFNLSKDLSFADMGSGRGRLCFWLRLVRGQKSVIGIERLSLFVERARSVQRWFNVSNVTFLNEDWEKASLEGIDIIYLYGSALDDDRILALATRLQALPKGTKIITTSYSLDEFFPEKFIVEKKISVRYIWGTSDVYLQSISS